MGVAAAWRVDSAAPVMVRGAQGWGERGWHGAWRGVLGAVSEVGLRGSRSKSLGGWVGDTGAPVKPSVLC